MKRTFYAKEPGRYVQIERNLFIGPGEHKLNNSVTGYKMVIDLQEMTYESFITEGNGPWVLCSTGKRIKSPESFWLDVDNGHLFEREERRINLHNRISSGSLICGPDHLCGECGKPLGDAEHIHTCSPQAKGSQK